MNYNDLRALLTKRFHIPKEDLIRRAVRRFTLAEKSLFYFFAALFVVSGVVLLLKVDNSFLVEVPIRGGTMIEGVVGNPRFINPVLALSEADKNLTSLVYSGLVRATPTGEMQNDLADNVTISEDGLTYTAHIKDEASFQDGVPVTADDMVYTIQRITDPAIKSPLFGNWSGVEVTAVDSRTLTFTLKRPYSPFIENLTIGILPKHIWNNVSADEFSFSQFNSLPIGSGEYKIETVERDSGGIPNYYELTPAKEGTEAPYIAHLVFKFYPSEADLIDAFESGDIQSLSGISPDEAVSLKEKGAKIVASPLPRVFAVFFNQSQSKALLDKTVRTALDLSALKEEIVSTILDGYATPLDGPLPPKLYAWSGTRSTTSPYEARLEYAESLLAANGWTKNAEGILEKKSKSGTIILSFTLSTSDNPELKSVGDLLKEAWAKLGARVEVQVFDPGDLNQSVIRPRHYDALLFGEVVGRDADVYPFWHSSERNDPGLNIALYANSKADKALEDARTQSNAEKREADYKIFDAEVRADVPAVFLYSPSFLYVVPKNVKGLTLGDLGSSEDRFLGINDWYVETDKVWRIFVNN
ncbi:peptide ABC transporter substrate-binding protein [Candidatus Parcubacteria bacterium]|nr:peptide ABC transporter substrate-binding protein [Candidatus Parcubacteria bacterium]